jgi:hypothetical protein
MPRCAAQQIQAADVSEGSFATEAVEANADARPLRFESGQVADHLGRSALCHEPTYAVQHKATLFDHLVRPGEQHRRNIETERLGSI